jgi:hypothetical protein
VVGAGKEITKADAVRLEGLAKMADSLHEKGVLNLKPGEIAEPRTGPATITDVSEGDGRTPTFWKGGEQTSLGKTETFMGLEPGKPFHLQAVVGDQIVGATHGTETAENVHGASVYTSTGARGTGVGAQMTDAVLQRAAKEGKTASFDFENKALGARTVKQAEAAGWTVTEDSTGRTYFHPPTGNVHVSENFPGLKAQAEAFQEGSGVREQVIKDQGLMNEGELAERRNLPGQIIGSNRPGQAFATLHTYEQGGPQGLIAKARGVIVPKAKNVKLGKTATGSGLERGMIPGNVTRVAAGGVRAALRSQASQNLRAATAELGSAVRRSKDDYLVNEQVGKAASRALPDETKVLMGKMADNTITPAEESDLAHQMQNYVEKAHINTKPTQEVGERAPAGWKFVHPSALPDSLKESATARGKVEKAADTMTAAITAATVYTKIGHIPQRLLTNATTNLVQGSLNPVSLWRNVQLIKTLSDRDKMDLEAMTGGHASSAPLSGVTSVNRLTRGTRWLSQQWARRADAMFRLNSITHELRKQGYDTPEQIRKAIDATKDPTRSGLSGSEIMKIDGAVRRSNRAAIMYDGLSTAEKRYVARYLWFYPWTKGAIRFAGHTVAEHPIKAAIGAAYGLEGAKHAHDVFGAYPPWANNITPIGKSGLSANLSSLMPYGTVSDTINTLTHPLNPTEGIAGSANPAVAAGIALVSGKGLKGAANEALSPTPEYQIGQALFSPRGSGLFPSSSSYLYGRSWQSASLRAVLGTATLRKVNKSKLNEYASRIGQKKRTITIYGGGGSSGGSPSGGSSGGRAPFAGFGK